MGLGSTNAIDSETMMQDKQGARRQMLIEAAQNERPLYYGDIAPSFGLDMGEAADRREIGRMLDAINRVEHGGETAAVDGRGPVGQRYAGVGILPHGKEVGYEVGNDRKAFWAQEVTRVYSYWAGQPDGLTDEQPIRARAEETEYELSVALGGHEVVLTLSPQVDAPTDPRLVLYVYLSFPEAIKLGIRLQGKATEAQFNQGQGQGNTR